MKKLINLKYFSKWEWALWLSSLFLITLSFLIFDRESYLNLTASLIGATSLIFCAKGNPFGQVLIILFSTIYGYISFSCAYYGELMTYAGMTLPMAIVSLVSWLRNPYNGNKSEVKINRLKSNEVWFALLLSAVVTFAFYYILKFFGTANLMISTFSVATSLLAVYLTFRRSPYFAIAYALNDIVLIALWVLAAIEDKTYVSVVACFVMFLANDIYSFTNWRRMQRKQESAE